MTDVPCRLALAMTAGPFRIVAAFLLLATAVSLGAAQRPKLPEKERRTIEALIAGLESLTDVKFVRNGTAYSPVSAGKFLRAKWKDRAGEVQSAEDFIAKVATRSSTTRQPYLVRYSDGREIPTGAVLRRELERLRDLKSTPGAPISHKRVRRLTRREE
jgi:hypothetical protein